MRPSFCARANADAVSDLFCGQETPEIRSFMGLRRALKLTGTPYPDPSDDPEAQYDQQPEEYPYVVLLAHSTALSGAYVSSINPRAIFLRSNLFLAFTRGIQQIEIAAVDRETLEPNFYLMSFEQACNAAADGCRSGDLYTPRIEYDWLKVGLQDDDDLKNTPSDCRQCHQRGSEHRSLLMRELEGPWTHFFGPQSDVAMDPLPFDEAQGTDLMHDYMSAKGDEWYAGVPTHIVRTTVGFTLERMVTPNQPLIFDGAAILNERWPWSEDGYLPQAQPSSTWQASFDAFKRGEQLALPFYSPRASDPEKLARMTEAYQRYLSGDLAAEDLPDLSDVFPDDAQTRAEIGLQVEPDAAPAQLLVQACGSCHNDVLDQSISRARFNVAIGRLDAAEVRAAIARLKLARGAASAMPPKHARQLDAASLERLIDYLERGERSDEDDALLEHAAQQGMAAEQPRSLRGQL